MLCLIRGYCSLVLICVFCCLPRAAISDTGASVPAMQFNLAREPFVPMVSHTGASGYDLTLHEAGAAYSGGYAWQGLPPGSPDWRGIRRDTAYFLGYQFVALAALYIAPESISGWDSEQKHNYSFERWRDNVREPVWDEDRWWINYILHPYWGGAYYIRGRERGLDRLQSFWYSALLSTLFEYGAEALAEPVSAQDLVVTPVAGFLVGEYLFSPLREHIRAKPGELAWADKAVLFITDPLGVLNAQTDHLLGVKSALQFQPLGIQDALYSAETGDPVAIPSGRQGYSSPGWELQFRFEW